jgi:hypothetical protein
LPRDTAVRRSVARRTEPPAAAGDANEIYAEFAMQQSAGPASPLQRAGIALLVATAILATAAPLAWPQQSPAKPDATVQQKLKAPPPRIRYGTDELPRPVQELREALLGAIEAGEIDELRHALDLSERKPEAGAPDKATDPVAHWKSASGDGQGREVLAALSLILESGYVAVPRGADIENNQLYVWPYFAEVPLAKLTPRQEVELMRLVPAAAAREMKEKGKYTHWRLAIGADGTWHAFRKGD